MACYQYFSNDAGVVTVASSLLVTSRGPFLTRIVGLLFGECMSFSLLSYKHDLMLGMTVSSKENLSKERERQRERQKEREKERGGEGREVGTNRQTDRQRSSLICISEGDTLTVT